MAFIYYLAKIKPILVKWQVLEYMSVQAFLNFCGFDFRDFRFNAVYKSILFSSPLVLPNNLVLRGFCLP